MNLLINRTESTDQGTFGELIIEDDGFVCYTCEPPWKDNKPQISCIPAGEYKVRTWNSKKFPRTFRLFDVPGRDAILIHTGNMAGDKEKGYLRHSLGCILPGKKRGWIAKQKAVLLSVVAMRELTAIVGRTEPFNLSIVNHF